MFQSMLICPSLGCCSTFLFLKPEVLGLVLTTSWVTAEVTVFTVPKTMKGYIAVLYSCYSRTIASSPMHLCNLSMPDNTTGKSFFVRLRTIRLTPSPKKWVIMQYCFVQIQKIQVTRWSEAKMNLALIRLFRARNWRVSLRYICRSNARSFC